MELMKPATAGTLESNDILITLEPVTAGGLQIALRSNVMQQYGRQIEAVIRETLNELGVENAMVDAVDKGALDCTIRARVSAAAFRSAESQSFQWEVRK